VLGGAHPPTAASILTAFSTGSNFRAQYSKDVNFMGGRVMVIKAFFLEKT
jgi:hypothetical protein